MKEKSFVIEKDKHFLAYPSFDFYLHIIILFSTHRPYAEVNLDVCMHVCMYIYVCMYVGTYLKFVSIRFITRANSM